MKSIELRLLISAAAVAVSGVALTSPVLAQDDEAVDAGASANHLVAKVLEQNGLDLRQRGDLIFEALGPGVELLAEGHGHRVLHLGAAHLEHVGELVALGTERGHERSQLLDQPPGGGSITDVELVPAHSREPVFPIPRQIGDGLANLPASAISGA